MTDETSRDAYHDLRDSGALTERQREAWESLNRHGPATANELVRAAALAELADPPRLEGVQLAITEEEARRVVEGIVNHVLDVALRFESLDKRLSDLVRADKAEDVEVRKCQVTGRRAKVRRAR